MNNPKVTVLSPVYNRKDMLIKAIDSVLKQSFSDFEYIIVDDASTEDIKSVVESFADPRLVYVKHDENRMMAESYNTGIGLARGEFIALLESDDVWYPDKLKKQLDIFNEDSRVGAVYCGMEVKDTKGKIIRLREPKYKGDVFANVMNKSVISSLSTLMIRRSAAEVAGRFDPWFGSGTSYEYELRLASHTEFGYVPSIEVSYLQHEDNLSNILDKQLQVQTLQHERLLEIYSDKFKYHPKQYENKLSSLGMNYLVLGDRSKSRKYFYMARSINKNIKNLRNIILSHLPFARNIILLDRFIKNYLRG